jgi:hypothetical protein
MIPKNAFLLLCFLTLSLVSQAQKVKYKDLFLLLNAHDYDKAEPFLKKYLKDNDDNPNAFLFMGIIYHEKANHDDVLKQTDHLGVMIDSAVLFYDKAYKTITEREIKKNDDYYEMYKRRDLRTGDFGIKLSDVQFDLEKRTQGLKEKKDRVKKLKEYYVASELAYQRANVRFKNLQEAYPDMKALYLQSTESSLAALKHIVDAFDSCMASFAQYKSTLQLLGKTGYNQVINLQEIKDFKRDGGSQADFTQEDLKVWDYKRWAQGASDVVEKEIMPIRDYLVSSDLGINKLRGKIKKDSVSVRGEGPAILKSPFIAQLRKFDADPMPLALFDMKVAELEYASQAILNRNLKDSVNLPKRLAGLHEEIRLINGLDSLAVLLDGRDLEKDGANYSHFITHAYGTADVLKSLIKTTREFADREKAKKQKQWEIRMRSLKWIVVASDSIPLFNDATSINSRFKPFVIEPEDFTMGLKYTDSVATGYFYSITPSRVPDIKVSFPVGTGSFKKRNLPLIKGFATRDEKKQVYFALVYSEAKTSGKFPVVIAKIYRSDGLAWSHTYQFDMAPASISYAADAGELSVKVTNASGDSRIIVIDKAGKQLQ